MCNKWSPEKKWCLIKKPQSMILPRIQDHFFLNSACKKRPTSPQPSPPPTALLTASAMNEVTASCSTKARGISRASISTHWESKDALGSRSAGTASKGPLSTHVVHGAALKGMAASALQTAQFQSLSSPPQPGFLTWYKEMRGHREDCLFYVEFLKSAQCTHRRFSVILTGVGGLKKSCHPCQVLNCAKSAWFGWHQKAFPWSYLSHHCRWAAYYQFSW